jgi:4-hydroxythreonine-4-phosphate dehydrogenase
VSDSRPIVGITMGDPVGIGPELICMALCNQAVYDLAKPLVLGDVQVLEAAKQINRAPDIIATVNAPAAGAYKPGCMDVLPVSNLRSGPLSWGKPSAETGRAMLDYITTAVDLALKGDIAAMVTCPINKAAMRMCGSRYHGHTELIADRTGTTAYVMMMAGDKLRVSLVTIHLALRGVAAALSVRKVVSTVEITADALKERFAIPAPRIAVAGLNPHSGEEGMFGDEEIRIIRPAIAHCRKNGIDVSGPYPADTLFYHAVNGVYDAVVCMYHDQGLIPFKMIHFTDGVNTTLGLPIIRTSVDHGTAYDIAGKGIADPGSLIEAIRLAARQAVCRIEGNTGPA